MASSYGISVDMLAHVDVNAVEVYDGSWGMPVARDQRLMENWQYRAGHTEPGSCHVQLSYCTVWQLVPFDVRYSSPQFSPYVRAGSFFSSLVGYFPIIWMDHYMYQPNIGYVCPIWCSAYSYMNLLQMPHGGNCHQPSCTKNALLQLQQITCTLQSSHWHSGIYMTVTWHYALSSQRRILPSSPLGSYVETSFLEYKLIVRILIESLGLHRTLHP